MPSSIDRRMPCHGQSDDDTPEARTPDPRAVASLTVDGGDIQVLELRGTIIRLREQLDRIHARYEEKVRRLESLHRARCRELEDTIRHMHERLNAGPGAVKDN